MADRERDTGPEQQRRRLLQAGLSAAAIDELARAVEATVVPRSLG